MTPFSVTVFDPDEDYDDVPESLTSLGDWLAVHRAGQAPFEPDVREGFGVCFDDGAARYLEEGFGNARALAFGLRAAADRLASGRIAVLRTSYMGPASRLLLVPDDDGVRIAQVSPDARPPGDWDAHTPGPRASTLEQTEAIYAWASAISEEQLAPTDKPAADAARGLEVYLDRETLIPALRRGADDAFAAAVVLGCPSFTGGDTWTPAGSPEAAPPSSTAPAPRAELTRLQVSAVQPTAGRSGAARLRIIQIIRTFTGLSYQAGKGLYARAVAGEGFALEIPDRGTAESTTAELRQLGATVELLP